MVVTNLFVLYRELDELEQACRCLEQTPRRKRGAWVKPGLAGSAHTLETALLKSYRALAVDVLASLRGAADDVSSGRLAQAADAAVADAEVDAAMRDYDVPLTEKEQPVDRSRLAAILVLLLRWRHRHTEIAEDAIHDLFTKGHEKALAEAGQRSQMPLDTMRAQQAAILARFGTDLDRLETGLRDGTVRAHGVEWIVQNAATLGAAAAYLHRLLNGERYRVEMFAEALAWRAYSDGYRVGAVDATQSALKDAGVTVTADLKADDLDAATKAQLPAWVWSGPDDEKCCSPCLAAFDEGPIYALALDDLPAPEDVCSFGINCRHWYSIL